MHWKPSHHMIEPWLVSHHSFRPSTTSLRHLVSIQDLRVRMSYDNVVSCDTWQWTNQHKILLCFIYFFQFLVGLLFCFEPPFEQHEGKRGRRYHVDCARSYKHMLDSLLHEVSTCTYSPKNINIHLPLTSAQWPKGKMQIHFDMKNPSNVSEILYPCDC